MTPTKSGKWNKIILNLAMLPICWLGMMLVHEFGHVLGVWFTGGVVEQVVWHPLVISRTDVSPHPSPLIVVWAGPIVGCLLPVTVWACLFRWRQAFLFKFFAGFCLIANGAYIGAGSFEKIGDCREMLHHETPIWLLWLFGITACSLGFYFWNGLGPKFGWGKEPELVSWKLAISVTGFSLLMISVGFLFGNRG